MASDILSHEFTVSRVPYQSATDAILNLRKRKERIIYSATTKPANINLAFVESSEVNSDDNLFISDHSTTLSANRINNTDPVVFTGASFTIDVNAFLLTDEFTVATSTHPETPLFFKHLIPAARYNPSTDQIHSLEVLDSTFRVVPDVTDLSVKTSSHDGSDFGTVFNNLENTYNGILRTFNVFYLRYTIKKNAQTHVYVDVLNNLPVYREATFVDLDGSNNILPDRKVYLIEESSGSFLVTLENNQYAVLQTLKSRIKVERPSFRDSGDDWFLTITNGQFFATEFNGSSVIKYSIPEFSAQLFEPYFPFKAVTREEITSLGGGNLFKTAHENIAIDTSQEFHVLVELIDEDGDVAESFSTNPTLVVDGEGIRSIDQFNGFIDLYEKPLSTQTVKVSYVYEEKKYQFTEVDFNPANNINVAEETIVIYVVPQGAARERTLFYLTVDKLGKIIFSSENEYGDDYGLTIGSRIGDPLGFYYNTPTANQDSFIDLYTVETVLASGVDYLANPGFLVLAEVYTGEAISPVDLNVVDIRTRGGGIVGFNRKQLIAANFESIWNWDIGAWEGQPYPGTATCFVEVPCELLVGHGGLLEEIEIRPIVQEHMAFGVYPIIKTYGSDPIITTLEVEDTEVSLEWTDLGPEVTYNVYVSEAEVGPFELLTEDPLAITSYTASGLTTETKYWFFVTGIKDEHECTDADDVYVLNLETR